jgi:biotin carboxyl carrier protein
MKKHFRIMVNGKAYEVIAEVVEEGHPVTPVVAPIAATLATAAHTVAPTAAATRPAGSAAGAGDVPSPLAGKVVSIDAPAGTAVKAGQRIITLEAMKMNTIVSAPADGTVQQVMVHPGDGVEEGQVLMHIS